MARKHINTILSSGIFIGCVLLLAADVNAQSLTRVRRKQFTISGSVGVANVALGGLPGTIVSDASGNYSVIVDYNWKGTVIPRFEGYDFSPTSFPLGSVIKDQSSIDFQARQKTFAISGSVGLPGVVLMGFPGMVVSDRDGKFSVTVNYGFNGSIIPELEGYTFTPASLDFDPVKYNQPGKLFKHDIKKYLVSGTAVAEGSPLSNVTLKGLPGNPKTGANGRYTAEVPHNWTGIVTPVREGHTFEPAETPYTSVMAPMVVDYYATQLRYTVSGNVGAEHVPIRYPGGDTYSDAMGNYSFELNWGVQGDIVPKKDGYYFQPVEILLERVMANLVEKNFTPQEIFYTIGGTTGQPNVQLEGLVDLDGQIVVSNAQGSYQVKVRYGSSYSVIPRKEGFDFTPASKQYSTLTENKTGESYQAIPKTFEITGSIGLPGVVMKGPAGRYVTDLGGMYKVVVPYNWSGTITPELAGYQFDPPSNIYEKVKENYYSNTDYIASKIVYKVTGIVTSPNGPVQDAIIMFGALGGLRTATDAQGHYELGLEHGETGKLSVGKLGFICQNNTMDIAPMAYDREVNFLGKIQMLTISGMLQFDGEALSEVRMSANNGGGATITNSRGEYKVEVPYGWTGEIAMTKPSMEIDEVLPFVDPVTANIDMTKPRPRAPVANNVTPENNNSAIETPFSRDEGTKPAPRPIRDTRGTPSFLPSEGSFAALEDANDTMPTIGDFGPGMEEEAGYKYLVEQIKELKGQLNTANDVARRSESDPNMADKGPWVTGQNFQGEEIQEAFQIITQEIGIPIIADAEVLLQSFASFESGPLETILDIMLAGTNYTWTKTPNYYLVSTMSAGNAAFIPGTITQSYKMTYITAEAAVAMLSIAFKQYVRAEPKGHLVTITAAPSYVKRIISDLKSFDMTRPQVLLKSRVVVMEEGDLLNMGIEWSWPSATGGLFASHSRGEAINADYDSGGKGIWGVQLGYSLGNTFTNALTLGLNLLQENDKAQMIASPSAMAQDGHLSEMSVITEEYFMLTPQTQNAQIYSQSEMEMIESGVKLSITPYIGSEDDIMMDIAVELSDSNPSGRSSGLPVVTRRTSSGRVTVKDGGSAVIAGLNENRRQIKEKRTPGLSRIPLIGKLFDNTKKDVATRDVAIFVTANIVRPGSGNVRPPMAKPEPVVEAPKEPLMGGGMFNNTSTMNDLNAMSNNPVNRPLDNSMNASQPPRYQNKTNQNLPGTFDSFQAELRRTIAESRNAYN